jgi:hypothetical protein
VRCLLPMQAVTPARSSTDECQDSFRQSAPRSFPDPINVSKLAK